MPEIETIDSADLPKILSDFYTEVKKKDTPPKKTKKGAKAAEISDNCPEDLEYKNSSLHCMQAALNRYFKEQRGLDIIANPNFIQANEMFKGVTKKGRCEGRGSAEHKKPISEGDMDKLSNYFTKRCEVPHKCKTSTGGCAL